jgi:ABC-type dipeptide/oligopeptide/nickel transport system ATPase component
VNDDKYEINNVVSVIGERGSGKTSFLLSIMNSLRKKQQIEGFGSSNEVFVIDSLIEPPFL